MIVTAWNNGTFKKTGAGYGIRIRKEDRDQHFNKKWNTVSIQIDDEEIQVNISQSFWNRCSELRSAKIGRWIINKGHQKWSKRQPPLFNLIYISGNKFRLEDVNFSRANR